MKQAAQRQLVRLTGTVESRVDGENRARSFERSQTFIQQGLFGGVTGADANDCKNNLPSR